MATIVPTQGNLPLKVYTEGGAASFLTAVSLGMVDGYTHVNKFGRNSDLGAGTETLWMQGGQYEYTDASSPVAYYISSSDNGDNQDYEVQGLGPSFAAQTVTVTCSGQTKTQIPDVTWTRVFRVINKGTTDNAGNIYIYEDDTVTAGVPDSGNTTIRGFVSDGENQSQMAFYTVPAGKMAYLADVHRSSSATGAFLVMRIRESGGVFRTLIDESFQQQAPRSYRLMPSFPAGTDIEFRGRNSGTGAKITAEFDLLLVDV